MGPESDPNRIFDAEPFGKPLGDLLERSWRLLEPKKVIVESLLGDLEARDPQMSGRTPGGPAGPATGGRQPGGRGYRGVYT